ncbi:MULTISPECIES: hypothetical protein [unclassified Moraxella]|uniref:hypothetical protein n=1 Tax=unclassified Moraxella TaxID=2685852 RepID=UPI003AF887F5
MPKSTHTPIKKPHTVTLNEIDLCQLLDEIEGVNCAIDDVTKALNLIRFGDDNTPAKALASLSIETLCTWGEILAVAHADLTKTMQGVSHE